MVSKLDLFCRVLSVTGDIILASRWYNVLQKHDTVMGITQEDSINMYKVVTQHLAKGFVNVQDIRKLREYIPSCSLLLSVVSEQPEVIIPSFMGMLLDDLEVNYGE